MQSQSYFLPRQMTARDTTLYYMPVADNIAFVVRQCNRSGELQILAKKHLKPQDINTNNTTLITVIRRSNLSTL
jgi:hypothetical protein